jgi:hypothetical protein
MLTFIFLRFILRRRQYADYRTSSDTTGGSGRDLTDVISRNLPQSTEENLRIAGVQVEIRIEHVLYTGPQR